MKKRLFEPKQMVSAMNGQTGMVLSQASYDKARQMLSEGRKPGRYFAPGCCHNPDYVTQVPVLFEDGTYDVMRSMNIRKTSRVPEAKQRLIRAFLETES
jgi:hypothetical protein